jgi:hypothetical protein
MYMMWRQEHLWNVSVLQRVHLSNLVTEVKVKVEGSEGKCNHALLTLVRLRARCQSTALECDDNSRGLVGAFFFDNTITCECYLNLLTNTTQHNTVQAMDEDVDFFQQDGPPTHITAMMSVLF